MKSAVLMGANAYSRSFIDVQGSCYEIKGIIDLSSDLDSISNIPVFESLLDKPELLSVDVFIVCSLNYLDEIVRLLSAFKVHQNKIFAYQYSIQECIPHSEVVSRQKQNIFVCTLPKSGTVFLKENIAGAIFHKPTPGKGGGWYLDNGQSHLCKKTLEVQSKIGGITGSHLYPSKSDIDLLNICNTKTIVHVRDPRQALVSWIHFYEKTVMRDKIWSTLFKHPKGVSHCDFEFHFENFYLKAVDWLNAWMLELSETKRLKNVLVTRHEDLAADSHIFNRRIADYIGLSASSLALDKAKASDNRHFRAGKTEEWRSTFSSNQLQCLNSNFPGELAHFFGWSIR